MADGDVGDPYAAPELAIGNLMAQQQAGYRMAETQAAAGNPFGATLSLGSAPQAGAAAVQQQQQLTPQKMAAMDDYAKALNYRDETGVLNPWAYAAANPDMHPYAKYRLLASSPNEIATDRVNLANAAQTGLAVQFHGLGLPAAKKAAANLDQSSGGGGGTSAPGAASTSGGGQFTPPAVQPSADTGASGGATMFPGASTSVEAASMNPLADMPEDPAARAEWYASKTYEERQKIYNAMRHPQAPPQQAQR